MSVLTTFIAALLGAFIGVGIVAVVAYWLARRAFQSFKDEYGGMLSMASLLGGGGGGNPGNAGLAGPNQAPPGTQAETGPTGFGEDLLNDDADPTDSLGDTPGKPGGDDFESFVDDALDDTEESSS